MTMPHRSAFLLVPIGLLGLTAYELTLRIAHPPLLADDRVHGLWVGCCLGLQLLGLIRLRRARGGAVPTPPCR